MLADAIVRLQRGKPDRRYAAEPPMVSPVSIEGLHNWLRAQIAGQGMYHMLGQLGKARQEARGTRDNMRDTLFDRPDQVGNFGELVTAPNADHVVPVPTHRAMLDILHRMHAVLQRPEEHLAAYTPGHEFFEPTNQTMAEEMHGFDWRGLRDMMMHADNGSLPAQLIDRRTKMAQDSGELHPLLLLQRMLPFSPHRQTMSSRAQHALMPFLQHQQVRRNEISHGLHQLGQKPQYRPEESVPEDYYAL